MRQLLRTAATRLQRAGERPEGRYGCSQSLLPPLRDRFLLLRQDLATWRFLQQGAERDAIRDFFAEIVAALLQLCLTASDANLLCGLGQMFVLSTAQARALLDASGSWRRGKLLDCGAGDGSVTAYLEPLAEKVFCTEVSHVAADRLRQRGWACTVEEVPFYQETKFDVISCLNVLCRAKRPLTLLRRLRELLNTDGVMLLAIVLPFRPVVLGRARTIAPPLEQLPQKLLAAKSFEAGVSAFAELVLHPLGLFVSVISRAPYYSRGTHGEYYVLDDALFVCRMCPETR